MLALAISIGLLPVQAADADHHLDQREITRKVSSEQSCEDGELDSKCEAWTAAGAIGDKMVVSPAGDRIFTWGPTDSRVAAHNGETGEKLWEATFTGLGSATAHVKSVAVSPDGRRIYIVGDDTVKDALHPEDRDLIVAAHDAGSGSQVWRRTLGMPPIDENDRYVSRERGFAVAVSPDGQRVYVAGDSRLRDRLGNWITLSDVLVAGYDTASGTRRWMATWGQRYEDDSAYLIRVSPDGRRVYVAGTTALKDAEVAAVTTDYLVVAFRAREPGAPALEGKPLWDSSYSGFGLDDWPIAIDLPSDGRKLFITGWSEGLGGARNQDFDWATAAYDTGTGDGIWVARFNGPADDHPHLDRHLAEGTQWPSGLAAGPDGRMVFVTGSFEAVLPGGPLPALSSDGRTVPTYHAATVAYDAATGDQVWLAPLATWMSSSPAGPLLGRHHASPDTGAASLALSPHGERVYVAGHVNQVRGNVPTDSGQVTVAYESGTGDQVWAARVPGTGPPAQVAANPTNGFAYVLGQGGVTYAYESGS